MTASKNEDTQIEAILREATVDPDVISFAGGFPATETFPRAQLLSAAEAALSKEGVATSLQYAWPEGKEGLLEWVVERLARRDIHVTSEDVIITSGAQQALSLSADAILGDGARVLVDPYCYSGALDVFRARGAALTTRFEEATCAYQMPGVTNPRGDAATEQNLGQLLALNGPIIADEAYAELRFDGRAPVPLRALLPTRVFLIGSVSKTLCPGFRLGWLVPPEGVAKTLREDKRLDDLQASTFSQAMLLHWLRHNDYGAHLRRSRRLYRARAHCMTSHLHELFPEWLVHVPEGGFSVLVDTQSKVGELELLDAGRRHGVVYDPGSSFRSLRGPEDNLMLRLCFSNLSTPLITRGLARLRRAWQSLERMT